MDRRTIARAVTLIGWYLLLGAVVVVYAWIVVAHIDSVFGPARDALTAMNGALAP